MGHTVVLVMEPEENTVNIVSAGKHFSYTYLSDLSIVGTCDIFVYQMCHKSCDSPDWLFQSCL